MFRRDKWKSILSIILVIFIVYTSIGCTANPATQPIENKAPEDSSISIVDHLGREVKLEKKAEKIVSGYYITTSALIALGLKDNVIGIEAKAKSRPIYKLAAPEFLELPNVGTAKDFDLEGTIALNPDLVILPIRLKEAVESLESMGINVIAVNPEDMVLLKETIDMIGKATGTEEKADKLKLYYDEKLSELEGLVSENKMRIYLGGNSDFLTTATLKMYQNYLIETAGGINVASDIDDTYWATISTEQLLAYNPDIIILVPGASYSKDDILNNKNYAQVNAIKNNRVFAMPDALEMWDSPVPSSVLGIMWLSSILHEDDYSFEEFKQDVFDFYKEFYNIEISKDEIER